MNNDIRPQVPLFPIGLVLMPRMPLPLHIFEKRYKEMIARCLENDEPFGIVLYTGTTLQSVGCLAKVDSLINRYEDGRMDILTIGTERFRIKETYEDKAYLQADLELFHDEAITHEEKECLERISKIARQDLISFAEASGYTLDIQLLEQLEPEELSFMLVTTDIFSIEEKQEIIELRSTIQRMQRACAALDGGRKQRTMCKKIRKILGKNERDDINYLFN